MTFNTKIVGGFIALTMGLSAMAAPVMAASTTDQSNSRQTQNCSIGETFNNGSIVDQDPNFSTSNTNQYDSCQKVGR